MQDQSTLDTSQSSSDYNETIRDESLASIVTELTSDDVLLGRGVGPNEHLGNIRYREIVKAHQPEYLSTVNRSVKDKIAHKTIMHVKSNGGRFLRRVSRDKARALGFRRDVFVVAEAKTVIEKTKQALRFQGRNKGTPGKNSQPSRQQKEVKKQHEKEPKKPSCSADPPGRETSAGNQSVGDQSADDQSAATQEAATTTRTRVEVARLSASLFPPMPSAAAARDREQGQNILPTNTRSVHLPFSNSPGGMSSQRCPPALPAVALSESEVLRQFHLTDDRLRQHLLGQITASNTIQTQSPQLSLLSSLLQFEQQNQYPGSLRFTSTNQQQLFHHNDAQYAASPQISNRASAFDVTSLIGQNFPSLPLRTDLLLNPPPPAVAASSIGAANIRNVLLDLLSARIREIGAEGSLTLPAGEVVNTAQTSSAGSDQPGPFNRNWL